MECTCPKQRVNCQHGRNKNKGMKSLSSFFMVLTFNKKALLILTPFLTVIMNSKEALIGLLILIVIDLMTGAYKSLHLKKIPKNPFKLIFWKSIHSNGIRDTWTKGYEYGIGIIVIVIIESLIIPGAVGEVLQRKWSFAQLGIAVASMIELHSIFENMERVTNSNPLKKAGKLLFSISRLWKSKK